MQRVTFVYKSPNSTRDLNYHIAKLLAPGAYHGLDILVTAPPSMAVQLSAGYALTDEGCKIEETLPINPLMTIPAADPNFPRVDLIVLRHRYNPSVNPNPASYVLIEGTPTPPPNTPVPSETIREVGHPLYTTGVHEGDIILAEIMVPEHCTTITEDLIFNRRKVFTVPELQASIAQALYISEGNFVYDGWDLTSSVLNIMVSPGRGLLCGYYNETHYEYIITTLRAREFLYGPEDPDTHQLYQVGPNLTLNKQPDYASKLRITVTCTGSATAGNIYITGRNEFGDEINNETIYVNCSSNASVTVESISKFAEVYHEGIDAHELIRTNNPTIYIKDKPVAYIYAIGTNSGRAMFKAVYDPAYEPPCNEYLLGWAETDETHVISIYRWAIDSQSNIIDDLSPQCDGARKIFTMISIPKTDSELVILDGATLKKGSTKGYTIQNNIITLGALVQAPDGPSSIHGEAAADLWVVYRRRQP